MYDAGLSSGMMERKFEITALNKAYIGVIVGDKVE